MKTKYVKVDVSERLPDKTGVYHTESGIEYFNKETGLFYSQGFVSRPELYLDLIPDREEEMKEIIQTYVSEFKDFNFSAENMLKAEHLLNELK